jgi:uroporphyrinogen-III synthase
MAWAKLGPVLKLIVAFITGIVIGPVTQKVAVSLGLKVHAVAEVPTPEGICAALVVLFA